MKRLHFANVLLICVLGTLLLWPKIKEPTIHRSVSTAYDSVCMISSGESFSASGVLLESGYVLTAAHVVDQNHNGEIEDEEKVVDLKFPALGEGRVIRAEVVACNWVVTEPDLALLKPEEDVDLPGVKIMDDDDYWGLKIGQPLYTIGMADGNFPANITDGRMITMNPYANGHRNSANSYFGNSGGGVFVNERLVGIASAVGIGRQRLTLPIFAPTERGLQQIGIVTVPVTFPLANSSWHVPAPHIRKFLTENELEDALWEQPTRCPYEAYFAVGLFNLILAGMLFLVYGIMLKWMKS